MSRVVCSACSKAMDSRSMGVCPSCAEYLCPSCKESWGHRCRACSEDEEADNR